MKRALTALLVSTLILSATPLPVAAADTTGAPGAIRGSIQDANGQAMTGYRVKVTDADGKVYQSEPTGPDGKFEIAGLPAGTYTYSIVDPQGNPISVKMPPVSLEAGTVVTRPIAIIPKIKGKGPMIAWIAGGGAAVLALALAGGNDSSDNGGGGSMTGTSIRPSIAP